MPPKKKKEKTGQQQDLIPDMHPKNSKVIIQKAKAYKAVQIERIAALERETTLKQELLDLIKKENLQPMEGGKIEFHVDGATISITPRDELLKVKFDESME